MNQEKLVRVQKTNQITLPVAMQEQAGIKSEDLVSVSRTQGGVLIRPQRGVANELLDNIGAMLTEQEYSFEGLIESGREIRGELLREMYGIDPGSGV